jgi:hypothetical protein
MLKNETLAKSYRAFKVVGGPSDDSPCDEGCRKGYYCDITSDDADEKNLCSSGKKESDDTITSLMNKFAPTWFEKIEN